MFLKFIYFIKQKSKNEIALKFHEIRDKKHELILETKDLCSLDTSLEIDIDFMLNMIFNTKLP